jgi:putative ABC transport system permease protein
MALMIALTVVFTGANTLNTSVQDRINELATLRALGFPGSALVWTLLAEALLLAAAGGLVGLIVSSLLVSGSTFRIAMGAFSLQVGGAAVLTGFLGVLLLGLFGTFPAATKVLRLTVAEALKED